MKEKSTNRIAKRRYITNIADRGINTYQGQIPMSGSGGKNGTTR